MRSARLEDVVLYEYPVAQTWRERATASHAAYVRSMARYWGYDEASIDVAIACLDARPENGRIAVRARHIAVELYSGAVAIVRHPNGRKGESSW